MKALSYLVVVEDNPDDFQSFCIKLIFLKFFECDYCQALS